MNQPKTGSSNEYDQTTPRLFRLRDLHPPKAATSQAAAAESVSGSSFQAQPTETAMPASVSQPVAQKIASGRHAVASEVVDQFVHDSAAESAHNQTTQDSTEEQRTRDRIERHLDVIPEGRSWMESALAHRKALVLLVIAIGAAFWTSRDEQQQTNPNSELAQTSGSLEFDPTQFDAGTVVDEGQDYFPSEAPSDSTSTDLIADANNPAVSPPSNDLTPPQPTQPMSDNDSSPVNAQASEIKINGLASDALAPSTTNDVAVSDTLNSTQQNAVGNNPQTQPYASPEAELAKTQIQTSGLQVQAVSSKTPHDPEFNAPSLEDLERAAVESASNALGTELSLRNSETPNGVTDWLKYLPPQQ